MWWWFACAVPLEEPNPTLARPSPIAPAEEAAATPRARWRDEPLPSKPAERQETPAVARMRNQPLGFTHHARCRMKCRHFTESEVREILANGQVDPKRTRHDGACTSYALEGTTSDGQRARMVFGACERNTPLITAIDLDRKWPCECD